MTQPPLLPTCPHCRAIRTPGAPMCTQCWAPFDDARPHVVDPVPPPLSTPGAAAVVSGGPVVPPVDPRFSWNPVAAQTSTGIAGIPMQAGRDVRAGWHPTTDSASPNRVHDGTKVLRIVAAFLVGFLAIGVGGGYLWYRSTGESDKQLVADRFKNARPPGFLPAFPDFGLSGSTGVPESPGDAQRFVADLDPKVRKANDDIVALQALMFRWAKGNVHDDEVRVGVSGLLTDLKPLDLLQAPQSLDRAASKLSQAAGDYGTSLNALLDWMDSRNAAARTTYSLAVGDANVHWDEGLIALYRGSGVPQPALPHPQVKH